MLVTTVAINAAVAHRLVPVHDVEVERDQVVEATAQVRGI